MNHIISSNQFSDRNKLLNLFRKTKELKQNFKINNTGPKVFYVLFYEPSTRTRFSFETAILNLGHKLVTSENADKFSSAVKGETLEDSIRVLSEYKPTGIILRHFERGAAERAVKALSTNSSVSIINAGDGDGEHPTQSLGDLYTIWEEFGKIDNLEIALVGDLKFGRTIHSLVTLMKYSKNIKFHLVSPYFLELPEKYKDILKQHNIPYESYLDIKQLPKNIDVVYMTRLQLERFTQNSSRIEDANKHIDLSLAKSYFDSGYYSATKSWVDSLKKECIIMHPLPRVNEIDKNIDEDPRAAYFRQAGNGLPMRMALLSSITDDDYPFCSNWIPS